MGLNNIYSLGTPSIRSNGLNNSLKGRKLKQKSKEAFFSISTIVSQTSRFISQSFQPQINRSAKNTSSIAQFLFEAGKTGVATTTATAGALTNSFALTVSTVKAGVSLNKANNNVFTKHSELQKLESKKTNKTDINLDKEIESKKNELKKVKKKRGSRIINFFSNVSLLTGSITGTIAGIATIAAKAGSVSASTIGAVAAGTVLTVLAPVGILTGGVTYLSQNIYKGVKNVNKLNKAKKEVKDLKSKISKHPELREKLIEAEQKVETYQTKWNKNKKAIVVGTGLTITGAALAVATATGVGAPIAIGVGLALAATGIGWSGKIPNFIKNPSDPFKDDPDKPISKKIDTQIKNFYDDETKLTELNNLKEKLTKLTNDEANKELERIIIIKE